MNETLDENLAQTLFERAAEKCKDKKSRIAFCKEQLKKHGIDVDSLEKSIAQKSLDESLISKEYGKRPFGERRPQVEPVHVYHLHKSIPKFELASVDRPDAYREHIKAHLANKLVQELVTTHSTFIRFEEHQNFAMDTVEIHAAIKVAEWRK